MSWKSPMGPAAGDGTPQESFPEQCFISTSKRAEDSEKKATLQVSLFSCL